MLPNWHYTGWLLMVTYHSCEAIDRHASDYYFSEGIDINKLCKGAYVLRYSGGVWVHHATLTKIIH